jgi:hypothetical protein
LRAGLAILAEIALLAMNSYCPSLLLEPGDMVFHHTLAQTCFTGDLRARFAVCATEDRVNAVYAPLRHTNTPLSRVVELVIEKIQYF